MSRILIKIFMFYREAFAMRCRSTSYGLSLLLMFTLVGCGGGGSSTPPAERTGQFIDSAVAGLWYVTSSGVEGFTDTNGNFNYKVGDTVKLYVGKDGVLLGETGASGVLTPVSLVPSATNETNTTVQNIARFLQTLDEDSDPSNGISISTAVSDAAVGQTIDFSSSTFDSDAATLLNDIYTNPKVNMAPPTLVAANDAAVHLNGTIMTALSGSYKGTYTGDSGGVWEIDIDSSGNITGCGQQTTPSGPSFTVAGTLNSDGTAVFGSTSTGASYNGNFKLDGSVTGTWDNTSANQSGDYSGSRSDTPASCPTNGSVTITGDYAFDGVALSYNGQTTSGNFTSFGWRGVSGTKVIGIALTIDSGSPYSLYVSVATQSLVLEKQYQIVCTNNCSGISVNQTTHEITFTSVPVQELNLDQTPGTGSITLSGTLTYTAP